MTGGVDSDHPDFDNLLLYYDFEDYDGTIVSDRSSHGNDGLTIGSVLNRNWKGIEQVTGGNFMSSLPDMNIHQGLYFNWIEESVVLDSVENLPHQINYYSVQGTDLVHDSVSFFISGRRISDY